MGKICVKLKTARKNLKNIAVFLLILLSFIVYIVLINVTNHITLKQKHPDRNKRLLFMSIHQGTIDEVIYVFKRNGINYSIENLANFKEYDLFNRTGFFC